MDTDLETEKSCYNRGCGKSYKESENGPNSCTFHPGVPFFHDAYKGWTCCNRKCIDFTEFLGMIGCATGYHSNVKPIVEEPSKKHVDEAPADDVVEKVTVPRPEPMIRPNADNEMIDVKQEISPNLLNTKVAEEKAVDEKVLAKKCLNRGCSVEFAASKDNPVCVYHPGEAVFHEGLKFWSCCRKKSMEFEDFMNQKGCVQGEHLWIAKKKIDCRVDWHQTGTHVIFTIYTKGYDPNTVKVKANGVKLSVFVELPGGNFEKEWLLFGIIKEAESVAMLQTTKIEMKLRKAEPIQWAKLESE